MGPRSFHEIGEKNVKRSGMLLSANYAPWDVQKSRLLGFIGFLTAFFVLPWGYMAPF